VRPRPRRRPARIPRTRAPAAPGTSKTPGRSTLARTARTSTAAPAPCGR